MIQIMTLPAKMSPVSPVELKWPHLLWKQERRMGGNNKGWGYRNRQGKGKDQKNVVDETVKIEDMKRIWGPGQQGAHENGRIRLWWVGACGRMRKEIQVTGRIEWEWIGNVESDWRQEEFILFLTCTVVRWVLWPHRTQESCFFREGYKLVGFLWWN